MNSIFIWISESALARWVVAPPYLWPALESIHFVSLCVLFGSLLIIDLRLIGFYCQRCTSIVRVRDGREISRARTKWVFVSLERNRPTRIPPELKQRFSEPAGV